MKMIKKRIKDSIDEVQFIRYGRRTVLFYPGLTKQLTGLAVYEMILSNLNLSLD